MLHKSAHEILQIHFVFLLVALCLGEKKGTKNFFPFFYFALCHKEGKAMCIYVFALETEKAFVERTAQEVNGRSCIQKERGHSLNTVTATGQVWLKILQEFCHLQGKDFVFSSWVTYNLCFKVVICLFSFRS